MSLLSILDQRPLTIPYRKNLEKSPYMGDMFAQDIEPSGDYINYHETKWGTNLPNQVYGYITFQNPLIIEYISTGHGGWKTELTKAYGNKTGKKLTAAIRKDGYDAIITVDTENDEIMEIVNISGVKS